MCTIRPRLPTVPGEVNLLRPCITARVWALAVASHHQRRQCDSAHRRYMARPLVRGVCLRGSEVGVSLDMHNPPGTGHSGLAQATECLRRFGQGPRPGQAGAPAQQRAGAT